MKTALLLVAALLAASWPLLVLGILLLVLP
jgi:hypothetical protein